MLNTPFFGSIIVKLDSRLKENNVYGSHRAIIDLDCSAPLILDTCRIAVNYPKRRRHPSPIITKKGN